MMYYIDQKSVKTFTILRKIKTFNKFFLEIILKKVDNIDETVTVTLKTGVMAAEKKISFVS